jgi:hypothetical protein
VLGWLLVLEYQDVLGLLVEELEPALSALFDRLSSSVRHHPPQVLPSVPTSAAAFFSLFKPRSLGHLVRAHRLFKAQYTLRFFFLLFRFFFVFRI